MRLPHRPTNMRSLHCTVGTYLMRQRSPFQYDTHLVRECWPFISFEGSAGIVHGYLLPFLLLLLTADVSTDCDRAEREKLDVPCKTARSQAVKDVSSLPTVTMRSIAGGVKSQRCARSLTSIPVTGAVRYSFK